MEILIALLGVAAIAVLVVFLVRKEREHKAVVEQERKELEEFEPAIGAYRREANAYQKEIDAIHRRREVQREMEVELDKELDKKYRARAMAAEEMRKAESARTCLDEEVNREQILELEAVKREMEMKQRASEVQRLAIATQAERKITQKLIAVERFKDQELQRDIMWKQVHGAKLALASERSTLAALTFDGEEVSCEK